MAVLKLVILSFCTIIGWNPSQNRVQINIIAPCREQKNTCLLWTWNFLCLFSMIVIVCVPSKIHLKLENRWWNTITSVDIQMSAEKEPWLDLFFHFCFRRTVVKFFENANNNYMNIGYYIESMWLKREKKTVCYSTLFIILLRPKHTVVSCSNSIPLMQDMLGIRWHVKIEIDLTYMLCQMRCTICASLCIGNDNSG